MVSLLLNSSDSVLFAFSHFPEAESGRLTVTLTCPYPHPRYLRVYHLLWQKGLRSRHDVKDLEMGGEPDHPAGPQMPSQVLTGGRQEVRVRDRTTNGAGIQVTRGHEPRMRCLWKLEQDPPRVPRRRAALPTYFALLTTVRCQGCVASSHRVCGDLSQQR